MATFELYRSSTIGICLSQTLDEMVSKQILSPDLAIRVIVEFDKVDFRALLITLTAYRKRVYDSVCLLLFL